MKIEDKELYRRNLDFWFVKRERNHIRQKHNRKYDELRKQLPIKVDIHHEWIGRTAEYSGVAFVERHEHHKCNFNSGYLYPKPYMILEGEITVPNI